MSDEIDLSILDADKSTVVAFARRGEDVAIERIPLGAELGALSAFRDRMDASLRGRGGAKRPASLEIENFGRSLFEFAIRNDLRSLYDRLPHSHVSLRILTNKPELKAIPWEFWQEPHQVAPSMERSIVRIIPTVGRVSLPPLARGGLTRILFVAADPIGLEGVSWSDVKSTIERIYLGRFGPALRLDVIEGSDAQSLTQALQTKRFDVVHFSCHGDVKDGKGRLILLDSKTGKADPVEAGDLGRVLAGRQIRLVVLSACETSSGDAADDFAIVAESLIRMGIPAVVANQLPVPNLSVALFVGALYEELRQSGNIDLAVTAGRIALSMNLRQGPEWGIPTLYRLSGAAMLYKP
jgi:hypothetical protein